MLFYPPIRHFELGEDLSYYIVYIGIKEQETPSFEILYRLRRTFLKLKINEVEHQYELLLYSCFTGIDAFFLANNKPLNQVASTSLGWLKVRGSLCPRTAFHLQKYCPGRIPL